MMLSTSKGTRDKPLYFSIFACILDFSAVILVLNFCLCLELSNNNKIIQIYHRNKMCNISHMNYCYIQYCLKQASEEKRVQKQAVNRRRCTWCMLVYIVYMLTLNRCNTIMMNNELHYFIFLLQVFIVNLIINTC